MVDFLYVMNIKNILGKLYSKNSVFIALNIVVFGLVFGFVFGLYILIDTENRVRDTANKIVILYENEEYSDVVNLSENIIVRFAKDTKYKNQIVFHDEAKLALAKSYSHIGNDKMSKQLYLDILGYSLSEYEAFQYLSGNSNNNLADLATLMMRGE